MIILIPLEIGVREVYSKTLLSFLLAKKFKAKVYLFNSRSLFKKVIKLENCIIFDKSLSETKVNFHENLMKKNLLYSLDEEGPVYNWDKFTFQARNPDRLYKNLAGNFLISNYEKKFFKKKIKKKLFTVGHPKYDLLKKPYIDLYSDYDQQLKKKFGNYIYFSSSYSFDTLGGYDKLLLFTKKNYLVNKKEIKYYKKFLFFQKNDYKNYILFLKAAKEVANAFPKKKVILRPHPSQDPNLIKKRLKKIPKNLFVIFEKDAVVWIKNCDYYVHSHCTTSVDAAILKKKILRIISSNATEHASNPIYKNLGKTFKNTGKLIDFLHKNINNKNTYNFVKNKIPKKYLDNDFKYLSSFKIGDIFVKKFNNKKSIIELNTQNFPAYKNSKKFIFADFIKRIAKRIISNIYIYKFIDCFYELPADILLSKEYKEKKMNTTNLSAIPGIIHRLNRIDKINKKKFVKLKKFNNDIYQIY